MNVEEFTSCKQCLHTYTNPVILNCGHSVCLQCAVEQFKFQILSTQETHVKITCPECNVPHLESRNANLQTCMKPNRALQMLIEATSKKQLDPQQSGSQAQRCQTHNKELDVVCRTCSVCLCSTCAFSATHQTHDRAPIDEEINNKLSSVNKHKVFFSAQKSNLENTIKEINLELQNTSKLQAEHEEFIKTGFTTMKQYLDEAQKELLQAANNNATTINRMLSLQLSNAKRLLERFNTIIANPAPTQYDDIVELEEKLENFKTKVTKEFRFKPCASADPNTHYIKKMKSYITTVENLKNPRPSKPHQEPTIHPLMPIRLLVKWNDSFLFPRSEVRYILQVRVNNTKWEQIYSGPLLQAKYNHPTKACKDGDTLEFRYAVENSAGISDWSDVAKWTYKHEFTKAVSVAGRGTGLFTALGRIDLDELGGIAEYGNAVFVSNTTLHIVRKLDFEYQQCLPIAGAFGVAGYTDGYQTSSRLNEPTGIVLDKTKQHLFICDTGNRCIRRVNLQTKVTETFIENSVLFNKPVAICIDASDNLYVWDAQKMTITMIKPNKEATTKTTVSEVSYQPYNFLFNPHDSNELLMTCTHKVVSINIGVKSVNVVAGRDEAGAEDHHVSSMAGFRNPRGMCIYKNKLLVCDRDNHRIRQVDLLTGQVTTFAGNGKQGTREGNLFHCSFSEPRVIAVGENNCIYVGDKYTIKKIL